MIDKKPKLWYNVGKDKEFIPILSKRKFIKQKGNCNYEKSTLQNRS